MSDLTASHPDHTHLDPHPRSIPPLLPYYLIPQIKSAADFADIVPPDCGGARLRNRARLSSWLYLNIGADVLFKTAFFCHFVGEIDPQSDTVLR